MMNQEILRSGKEREFSFTTHDFETVSKLIYEHAGIVMNDSKQDLVYSRLARRLRVTGTGSFSDYLKLLDEKKGDEWQEFTNSLTTNLTSFFREEHHFPVLAEHLRARYDREPNEPIVMWCSAASTGEEPYSMAMTAIQAFESARPPVTIIATDLDTNVLKAASAGVYADERVEKLEPKLVKRFFMRGSGQQAGLVKVRPELRELISFRQLNLLADKWPLRFPLDAIFCRNVMIYFDKPTQLEILKKFEPLMREDGLLFMGHSESFFHADVNFKLRGKTVYGLAPRVTNTRSDVTKKHGLP